MKVSGSLFSNLCVSNGGMLYSRRVNGCPIVFLSFGNISNLSFAATEHVLYTVLGSRLSERCCLGADSMLASRSEVLFAGVLRKRSSGVRSDVQVLSGLLCGRCNRGMIVLVSRCSIPLSGTFRGNCCGRVISLVEKLFKRTLGAGRFLRFTILANYLHISGRDVFAKLGGFRVGSVISVSRSRRFNFASSRIVGLLCSCSEDRECPSMGR